MKKINKNIFWLFLLALFISCETTELNLLDDPNVPSAENLDPDTNLNFVCYSLSEFFEEATEAGAETVRLEYMFDTYQVNFNNSNVNASGMWTIGYADILNEIDKIEPILIESGRVRHLGILKIIRAYTLMTLVDYFGDVPLSDALNGGDNFPTVDPGLDVYTQALNDLDDALVDFSNIDDDLTPDANDLFYDGDEAKWTRFANSLKLKYYLSRRLIDQAGSASGIATILTDDNFITDSADDFFWQAGTSNNPQSKHQYYVEEYEAANTGEYIPNYLAWAMTVEKGVDDPRLRYYIYRQVNAFPTDPAVLNNEIDCWNDPRPGTYAPIDAISAAPLPFCSLFDRGDGYWGRDHSDNDGIPPDNTKRMTFGVYPAGGLFDDNQASGIDSGDGLNGAGLWPIMMNSFTYFMRAEAALYLGTTDDPRAMLEEGVRNSISTVMNSGGSYTDGILNTVVVEDDPDTPENEEVLRKEEIGLTMDDIEDYVDEVLSLYDAATSADERMAVVGKEYWLAMYGNGVEGYNLYRRTGTPINLQPTYLGTGSFPRSLLYPNVSVDRNPNINQKPGLTEQVFWDNNSAGFIQ